MTVNTVKEKALKNAMPDEIVTDELDSFRGYWVRSEEGDIIRHGDERGYWSSEPPTQKFREYRRAELAKSK